MTRRHYSSVAIDNALGGGIDPTQTAITLGTSWTGAPAVPFTAAIEPGTSNEEVVTVTALSGTSATIVRGADDSSGKAHSTGVTISHRTSARDFDEPNAHIAATTGVHGVTGALVGTTDTQVMSNKDLSASSNTFPSALVTLTGVQTQTNKTLISPTVNGGILDNASIIGGVAGSTLASDRAAWIPYTPTFTNVTSGAGSFAYRLAGKTLDIRGAFSAGTATGTGTVGISLPLSLAGVAAPQGVLAYGATGLFCSAVVNASDTNVQITKDVTATQFVAADSLVARSFNGRIEVA